MKQITSGPQPPTYPNSSWTNHPVTANGKTLETNWDDRNLCAPYPGVARSSNSGPEWISEPGNPGFVSAYDHLVADTGDYEAERQARLNDPRNYRQAGERGDGCITGAVAAFALAFVALVCAGAWQAITPLLVGGL